MVFKTQIKAYPRKDRGGWVIYLPSKLVEDSLFPFKPRDKLVIEITDNSLTIEKQ